ncbi:hypothetical protein KGQ20_46675, partial [Catenulispora sp. NF23]|uniref:hypothetical protein n=1 Tax=Catenulispora pinistramenti TaxID=2705254 RepID=UPI001BA9B4D9
MMQSTRRFAGLAGAACLVVGASGAAHAAVPAAALDAAASCSIPLSDLEYAPLDAHAQPTAAWTVATTVDRFAAEPVGGIAVRIAPGPAVDTGCAATISVAGYATQGATWESSGQQRFVAAGRLVLDAAHTTGVLRPTLPNAVPGQPCYAQFDLYLGDTVFDGGSGAGHGALPQYPDVVTPTGLIAVWNGQSADCVAPPSRVAPVPT